MKQFAFKYCEDFLEATTHLLEPHEFTVRVNVAHGGHTHTYETQFTEAHHHRVHDHGHHHHNSAASSTEYKDAHERAHAEDLKARFAGRSVTTKQVVAFGLTGGLMPCPAAFAILLICLQIRQFALGFTVVLGLAITLVAVGSIAALSVREASRRFKGFGELARRLSYASVGLMCAVGVTLGAFGLKHLLH